MCVSWGYMITVPCAEYWCELRTSLKSLFKKEVRLVIWKVDPGGKQKTDRVRVCEGGGKFEQEVRE